MIKIVLSFLVLIIAAGPVSAAEANYVILPESQVNGILHQCSRGTPGPGEGTWLPTNADIDALEKGIPPQIMGRHGHMRPFISEEWRRQYIGIIRSGRQFVYGNFFRYKIADHVPDWKSAPVIFCDGGTSFFGIEFEKTTGRISHFQFNGL